MTDTITAGRWTNGMLDPMRRIGDPSADAAIAETYALGRAEHVRDVLLGFGRNDDIVPADLPPLLRQYFERSAALPAWADPSLMDRGHTLLGRYQPLMAASLLCASLPLCYSCGDGAQVLARSQRLTSGVFRRLAETSQFLADVLDTGGLGPAGKGLRTAQKIRLLHATMRFHISRQPDWNPQWGTPVNQEDLAGTLQTFSVVIIHSLARLGVDLSTADRDAYFHIWRVVGHLLGVREQLNPAAFDDGAALVDAILARQQHPSDAGTELTKALLDFVRKVLPGPLFAGVGPTLIRFLAGDRAADVLAVPPAEPVAQLALAVQSPGSFAYGKAGDAVPVMARLAGDLGLMVFKEGLLFTNRGRRYEWQVPTGLAPTT